MLCLAAGVASAQDTVLGPRNIAIVVNTADAASVAAGEYYRSSRRIPARNLVRVDIPGSPQKLSAAQFAALKQRIDAALPPDIDVVVFAWTTPYAVECHSLTGAYSLGFDPALCRNTCTPSKSNPYFDTPVARPHAELGMRLSMLLPAADRDLSRAVVDRGRVAGFLLTEAGAYFVITGDAARNARAPFYPPSQLVPRRRLEIHTVHGEALQRADDVMIYEIGAVTVPYLDTLKFLPGALADHLTSFGGELVGGTQMSSLEWLKAGATASYGTVSEPCSYWQKFPHPAVLLKHYLSGASAVEAYWKSVAWPAQGLFIGEPLAAPYCMKCRAGR